MFFFRVGFYSDRDNLLPWSVNFLLTLFDDILFYYELEVWNLNVSVISRLIPSIQVEDDFLAVILKIVAPCHLGAGGILIMVPSLVSDFSALYRDYCGNFSWKLNWTRPCASSLE